ncbi:MAG: type II toxin-antitoxin system RelE/ParE family toxin [Rhodoferax sp.]|nr:type II toxin-antitoxin system RelE/ParE family toxin [Rhodoferax sp.]
MNLSVVWSVRARNQLIATLTYIAKEDPLSAELVHQRMEKSLKLLCDSPEMGVQAPTAGVRTYAVPKTGHSFDYRLVRDQIRVQRWYRQRQKPVAAEGNA